MNGESWISRRRAVLATTVAAGAGLVSAQQKAEEEEEVSPTEDLMREHGLLNRVLLYEDGLRQLEMQQDPDAAVLSGGADIVQRFIENYHEKPEEDYLSPTLHFLISRNEWDALGEDFEKREHQSFGQEGFDGMVEKVAGLEKTAGLYDLAQFTPR